MAWQRTSREDFGCSPPALWAVVGDPRRWPEWCDVVGVVVMTEGVHVGARLSYEPAGRLRAALHRSTAPPMRVTALDPGQRLVIEQPVPTGAMTIEWSIGAAAAARDTGCRLTQRVTVEGLLAPAVVIGVASGIARSWPASVSRLHALV